MEALAESRPTSLVAWRGRKYKGELYPTDVKKLEIRYTRKTGSFSNDSDNKLLTALKRFK